MRKILTILFVGGALALAGCATPGIGVSTAPQGSATTDPTIAAVQDAAAKVCAFVPTVSTVTGIIASFIAGGAPINAIVTSVAHAICQAVAPPKASMKRRAAAGPPMVMGVPVQGYFLR